MLDSLVRVPKTGRSQIPYQQYTNDRWFATHPIHYDPGTASKPWSNDTATRFSLIERIYNGILSMCSPIPAKQGQSCWIPLMHQRVHYRCRYLVTLKSMQFHTLFTLLPEYFSTFPHGTCLLTVLCIIFSLRGSLSPIFRLYYQTILLVDTIPYKAEWTANGPNTLYGFTSEYLCR